ncbi:MAG: helix-turn-helix domain-containing protein [Oscillospiraceae bacterium]|nr:helix-turn-helix domain-containing protein [Oscillospiraceae bacterium]
MSPEESICKVIKRSGMTIKAVSERTGIPYNHLQPSLKGNREMRADEYITLCTFFRVDPMCERNTA